MDNKIYESSELPSEKKIYLKRDWLGWRVVEPYRNPETGKINWFNFIFGGKRGLFIMVVILLITGLVYLGTLEMIGQYKTIVNDPCMFCSDCQTVVNYALKNINRQITKGFEINESIINGLLK